MKKMLAVFLALAMGASVMAGCSTDTSSSSEASQNSSGSSSEKEETLSGNITFATNRTDMDEGLADIIADFNKTYPDVTVEVEPIQDYVTAIKTRLGSGSAPDVMYVNGQIAPTKDLYPQFFLPLDDLGYTADDIYFYDSGVYENSVYTLCEGVNMSGMVCDMSTLKKVGIEETPKTLEEFEAACEALKAAGITPIGSMAMTKWPLSSWLTIASAESESSEEYYSALTSTDTPFTPDNNYGKMLSFVKNFLDKGYFDADPVSSDWDILRMDMSKTGFLYVANYALGALDGTADEDLAFFPLPIDNSGKQYTRMTASWNLAVNKNCEAPEAAKAFVKFWLEESSFQDDTGLTPSLKSRESGLDVVKKFMDQEPVVFEDNGDETYNSLVSAAQFSPDTDLTQEVMLGKSIEEVCDTYNAKWAEARKTL